jgi:hypothetical protein
MGLVTGVFLEVRVVPIYWIISSAGDAQDFGDLITARRSSGGCSNATGDRGLFAGGEAAVKLNSIDYITISSLGNANDFGDITVARLGIGATANA